MSAPDGTEEPRTGPQRRPDESMTLITALLERPLDPDYQAAADHRVARGLTAATSWRSRLVFVTALAVGVLLGVSAMTLGQHQGVRSPVKSELVSQIEAAQRVADEKEAQARELQGQIAALEQSTVQTGQAGLTPEELDTLRRVSGMVAVQGPGLVVRLDDARGTGVEADGNPRTGAADQGRVMSKDLQIVTNALWAAGAEGMAVNGQRLTSRSAIRFAGDAILVNFRPLVPPYEIMAIGDPKAMELAFGTGMGGAYLKTLSSNFGIQTAVETSDTLTLPAAAQVSTREATALPEGEKAPATVRETRKETNT